MSTVSIIILSSIGTALVFSFLVALWTVRRGPWAPWTYDQDRNLLQRFGGFARELDKKYEPRKQSGTRIDSAAWILALDEKISHSTPEELEDLAHLCIAHLAKSLKYISTSDEKNKAAGEARG